jgi:hypothetical protein
MGIFDDMEYACNAYAHGWRYAQLAERVKDCERRQKEQVTESITISFMPVHHYPVRAHQRRP